MSNLFSIHAVVPYVALGTSKSAPLEGQRLSKVTYKVNKETGIKPDSKCVSIPALLWNEVFPYVNTLSGVILAAVHTAQDKIIREQVESGSKEISSDSIRLEAVIDAMVSESTGRITGEVIRGWFKDTLKEPLLLAFASKLGVSEDTSPTPEQEEKLNKILKGYEDSFAKLASGAASFYGPQKDAMIKALELIESEDDLLAGRFLQRLSSKAGKEDELLMAL